MMEIMDVIRSRHSIRQYLVKAIEDEKKAELSAYCSQLNEQSSLSMKMVYDEPKCFGSLLSKLISFRNCSNYIVVAGRADEEDLEIKCGYYGELLVLKARELGLGTCWVGLTHGKVSVALDEGEKVVIIIALGYGANDGFKRRSKSVAEVSNVSDDLPDWYAKGIEAALLAPTAVNQQKFHFVLDGDEVSLRADRAAYSMVDLGIVKAHFELVSGHKVNVIR